MPPGTLDFVQTLDDAASVDPNLRRDVFMQDDFGITFGALRAETNQSLGRIKYDSASNEFRIEATTVGVAVDPALTFRTGTPAAERARITPLGALLVGATAPLAAERFRVSGGDAVLDFTSGSAFKVTQTGGANPALTVDTITAYGQVFVGDASSVGAESFGIRRDTVGSYAAIQTKNLTAAAVGTAARWEFTANETVSSDVPFGRIEWETTAVGAGVGTGKVTFSLRDVGVVNSVYEINETTDTHIWFLNGVEKMRVTAGAFTLDVTGATRITGKLTVTGSIDPTDVQLTTGTNLFFSSTDGSTAAVSAAGSGRIRYLNATPAWQVSLTTGAYSDIITAATIGTTAFVQGGNSFGATATLGTNDAFALDVRTSGVTRFSVLAAANTIQGSGGLTVQGGAAAGNSLTFSSTANATKGNIDFGTFARFSESTTQFFFGTQAQLVTERMRVTGGNVIFDFTATSAVAVRTTAGAFDMFGFDTTLTRETITNNATVTALVGTTFQSSVSTGENLMTLDLYDAANIPTYISRRARGTSAAPTAILTGDTLGSFSARGHDGTVFSASQGRFIYVATENWAVGAHGTRWEQQVTATGTTATVTRLRVDQNGDCQSNTTFSIFTAFGDAQPLSRLSGTSLSFGPGGATVVDVMYTRAAAGVTNYTDGAAGAVAAEFRIRSATGADYSAVSRWTGEALADFRGGFTQYDGTGNELIIGVHDAADALQASDIEVIRIARASPGAVGIQTAPVAGQALAFGGNLRMVGNNTFTPSVDNTGSVGTAALRFTLVRAVTITAGDLMLEDPESGASWVVREAKERGEDVDTLYAINRRTGKKYRIALLEVAA